MPLPWLAMCLRPCLVLRRKLGRKLIIVTTDDRDSRMAGSKMRVALLLAFSALALGKPLDSDGDGLPDKLELKYDTAGA